MGIRPRTSYVTKLKLRRCQKCGGKLGRHQRRCVRCHQAHELPGK